MSVGAWVCIGLKVVCVPVSVGFDDLFIPRHFLESTGLFSGVTFFWKMGENDVLCLIANERARENRFKNMN